MVKLTFVGDIFPANLSYNRNCGVASLDFDEVHRQGYVSQIRNIVSEDSLFIGNLESPILSEAEFSKEMQFAGHPNFVKMLKEAGISLLSIANNHILEHQIEGLKSTERILQEESIDYIGTIDNGGFSIVKIIEKAGLRLAFTAYNAIDSHKNEKGVISVYDYEKVQKDIKKLRQQGSDFIFVILHWGDEYIHRPSAAQIEQAHNLVDAGVNFVICSHPHVVQPIEEYHGGLICYSLGNFVFDMTIPKSSKTGMVVDIALSKDGFTHQERFVKLQQNYFPALLEKDHKVRKMLEIQKLMMVDHKSADYSIQYCKEKKQKRLKKRLFEKYLLLKNWSKYTPAVRRSFIQYYIGLLSHGKN